jgi:hypothetical protein
MASETDMLFDMVRKLKTTVDQLRAEVDDMEARIVALTSKTAPEKMLPPPAPPVPELSRPAVLVPAMPIVQPPRPPEPVARLAQPVETSRTLGNVVMGAMGVDGSLRAPEGAERPFPSLFTPYLVRPPWKVAGVDHGVGASGVLIDWREISGFNVQVNRVKGVVKVENGNASRLTGIDFALHGGCRIEIVNTRNWSIDNCRISNGPLSDPGYTDGLIQADAVSQNGSITRCTIGGGTPGLGRRGGALATIRGGGFLVVEYNRFFDSPQHALEITGAGITFRNRFNLYHNIGNHGPRGVYPTSLRWGLSVFSTDPNCCVNEFNTYVQPQIGIGGPDPGEVAAFFKDSMEGIFKPQFRNNVVICAGNKAGASVAYILHGGDTQRGGVCSDNWIDLTGARGMGYEQTLSHWTMDRNVNLRTGFLIAKP